jgi:hypothetical protein
MRVIAIQPIATSAPWICLGLIRLHAVDEIEIVDARGIEQLADCAG